MRSTDNWGGFIDIFEKGGQQRRELVYASALETFKIQNTIRVLEQFAKEYTDDSDTIIIELVDDKGRVRKYEVKVGDLANNPIVKYILQVSQEKENIQFLQNVDNEMKLAGVTGAITASLKKNVEAFNFKKQEAQLQQVMEENKRLKKQLKEIQEGEK